MVTAAWAWPKMTTTNLRRLERGQRGQQRLGRAGQILKVAENNLSYSGMARDGCRLVADWKGMKRGQKGRQWRESDKECRLTG